jgi:O-antigen ligase
MLLFLGAPLLLLTVWCLASVAWSVNPGVSLRRGAALLGAVILGSYAGLRFELKDMLRLMSYLAGIVLIGSLALAVVAPSLGLDYEGRLRGVFAHKNALGSFAALSLLVLVARLSEMNYRSTRVAVGDAALAVLCLGCMAIAHSTAVVPVVAVGLVLLPIARLIRTADAGVLALVPVAAALAIMALAAAAFNAGAIAEMLGKDSDISGRTLVWDFVIQMLLQRPWLGYGFGAFWAGFDSPGSVFWATQHVGVPHAHNGYLQLAVDAGGIGLALFLVAMIALAVKLTRLLRHGRETHIAWAVGFLGFYLVTNLSESWLWGSNDLLPVIFIYLVVRTNIAMHTTVIQAAAAVPGRLSFVQRATKRSP